MATSFEANFRPRARLLQLLGEQLIRSPRLAVFELVKNAYDADASRVTVTLKNIEEDDATITVEDDGEGMSPKTVRDTWLVPGDDHRDRQRRSLKRTLKYDRLPLGEKGLGRFAVHKLGNRIELTTRALDEKECVVEIDWSELIKKPFLSDAPVKVVVRDPVVFKGKNTGTIVRVSELRQEWHRKDVRALKRDIVSITSPFEAPESFRTNLVVPGREEWLKDLLDIEDILSRAMWRFKFSFDGKHFDWKYEFEPLAGIRVEGRKKHEKEGVLLLPGNRRRVVADGALIKDVGPVSGSFFVYDRDREVMKLLTETKMFEGYLDENGGIRVYRDGLRVYNYGEPGDDWLGLDLRRVNRPGRGISRNLIIGAVNLKLAESTGLMEKTNREGFIENDASERLKDVVLAALATLETERQLDKKRIKDVLEQAGEPQSLSVEKPIAELRVALEKEELTRQLGGIVDRIERDYAELQEVMLQSGLSGLNLALIFHEVERGVREIHRAIREGEKLDKLETRSRRLTELLEGFSTLLRRDEKKNHKMGAIVKEAVFLNENRFGHHHVKMESPLLSGRQTDIEVKVAFGLILGAISNIIDNAFYWLRVRWPDSTGSEKTEKRRLYIGISNEYEAGPALVIADNGPGFVDPPEVLVRPFNTRRNGGMGLGLYYANLAMELNGGELIFPQKNDLELPKGFDGAVVALVFRKKK